MLSNLFNNINLNNRNGLELLLFEFVKKSNVNRTIF